MEEDRRASSGGAVVQLGLRLWTGTSSSDSSDGGLSAETAARRSYMTILYGGRMCAVDVTQLQAMEIITMANQQISPNQQQHRSRDHHDDQQQSSSSSDAEQQPKTAAPGLSMKRSLQRFLLKRKTRAVAAVGAPYAAARTARPTRR